MLLQKGFKPFVLAQQKFKTSTDFLGYCRLVPLLACTPMFSRSVMFLEKTFELQRYINEPGLLFKFGFFKSFFADLVAKLPENCEVVKFQCLETAQIFLNMY